MENFFRGLNFYGADRILQRLGILITLCIIRMSLAEALIAATLNAAHSLGRGKTHGSIEVGKVSLVTHILTLVLKSKGTLYRKI